MSIYEKKTISPTAHSREVKMAVINNFKTVYGIDDLKAEELYNKGFRTISELQQSYIIVNGREIRANLTISQRHYLRYYEDLGELVSYAELDGWYRLFTKIFQSEDYTKNYTPAKIRWTIAGSNRILDEITKIDLLIIGDDIEIIYLLLDETKCIITVLDQDKTDMKLLVKLNTHHSVHQLDISLVSEKQWPFYLLFTTGPPLFIQKLTEYALKLGYHIELFGLVDESGNVVRNILREEDIFRVLGLKYVPPKDRRDFTDFEDWKADSPSRRAVSPTRGTSPSRAVSPTRGTSPTRVMSPVRTVSLNRAISPVRTVSPRAISSVRAMSPNRTVSPRAISPVRTISPNRGASPSRGMPLRRMSLGKSTSSSKRAESPTSRRSSSPVVITRGEEKTVHIVVSEGECLKSLNIMTDFDKDLLTSVVKIKNSENLIDQFPKVVFDYLPTLEELKHAHIFKFKFMNICSNMLYTQQHLSRRITHLFTWIISNDSFPGKKRKLNAMKVIIKDDEGEISCELNQIATLGYDIPELIMNGRRYTKSNVPIILGLNLISQLGINVVDLDDAAYNIIDCEDFLNNEFFILDEREMMCGESIYFKFGFVDRYKRHGRKGLLCSTTLQEILDDYKVKMENSDSFFTQYKMMYRDYDYWGDIHLKRSIALGKKIIKEIDLAPNKNFTLKEWLNKFSGKERNCKVVMLMGLTNPGVNSPFEYEGKIYGRGRFDERYKESTTRSYINRDVSGTVRRIYENGISS